jgi:uncharacterized protein YndB with AHSA1/START domain
MDVCATDIMLAPAERIWRLVTDPRELAHWSGMRLVEGAARNGISARRVTDRTLVEISAIWPSVNGNTKEIALHIRLREDEPSDPWLSRSGSFKHARARGASPFVGSIDDPIGNDR